MKKMKLMEEDFSHSKTERKGYEVHPSQYGILTVCDAERTGGCMERQTVRSTAERKRRR